MQNHYSSKTSRQEKIYSADMFYIYIYLGIINNDLIITVAHYV